MSHPELAHYLSGPFELGNLAIPTFVLLWLAYLVLTTKNSCRAALTAQVDGHRWSAVCLRCVFWPMLANITFLASPLVGGLLFIFLLDLAPCGRPSAGVAAAVTIAISALIGIFVAMLAAASVYKFGRPSDYGT
jgi:hypothetical protein